MFSEKFKYKSENSLPKRQNDCDKIRKKYPDKIPIICESTSNNFILKKTKFLVPENITMGQFLYIVRTQSSIQADQAIFLFYENGTIPVLSLLMSSAYEQNKSNDGLLYLLASAESSFG